MAGDDETALLAAGHVEAEFFLGRESEKLASEASHLGDEFRVYAMINNLKNSPVFASLNDFFTNLGSLTMKVVDPSEGDDWNFVAELVIGHTGALIFVPDEAGLEGFLLS